MDYDTELAYHLKEQIPLEGITNKGERYGLKPLLERIDAGEVVLLTGDIVVKQVVGCLF